MLFGKKQKGNQTISTSKIKKIEYKDAENNIKNNKIKVKQKYQNIITKKVHIQAEDALDVTEKLIDSVEEINIQIDNNNDNINRTVDVASEVGAFSEEVNASVDETLKVVQDMMGRAEIGQESVNNLIESIKNVQQTVANMQSVLMHLSEKSNKIKVIVDTIKGIAKTTHLLSLNANIEAARAGDAGKGFAVVAGEVKKLAESSSLSADEIDKIILEIVEVTEKTLQIIQEGIDKVIKSTEMAEESRKTISNLMQSVDKTKKISEQIGNAVREQADKNQYMISVIDNMVEDSERVKAVNENISVNVEMQKAALNTLKGTINNLSELSEYDREDCTNIKDSFNIYFNKIKSFDPAMSTDVNTTQVLNLTNVTLVQFGIGTEVISALAKNWHLENDNVTWNFYLSKGLKFHNGRNITAYDVKFSFERLLSKQLNSPNRWLLSAVKGGQEYYEGKTSQIEGIIVENDHNFKIVLQYPYSSFINNLAHVACSILPKEEVNSIENNPVGAGPYKVVEISNEKDSIKLEKFKEYKLGEALIDEINISHKVDDLTGEFLKENLDYITVTPSNINKIKQEGYDVKYTECLGTRLITFNFQSKNPLIENKKVRQAINYCVDKDRIIKEAFGGLEVKANETLPTSIINDNRIKGYTRDVNRAKQLMRESGITSGQLLLAVSKNDAGKGTQHKIIADILKENLKQIGLNLKTTEVESGSYYDMNNVNKVDMIVYGWMGDSGTADNFIEPLVDINNAANRNRYNNPKVMELLNEAKKIRNPYKYREMIYKIESTITDDAPYIFLSHICVAYACGKNVKGLKLHPLNIIKLEDVWKE
ncbi:ABC transporter substrate-binding protein [Haloimpatiens sp. FM7330]|uniref:ABC transporter substrate-binding protein n=1 Tax=Haloimpatiens sp. FM7330 TaxID=3298610 RepID=UPI003637F2E4